MIRSMVETTSTHTDMVSLQKNIEMLEKYPGCVQIIVHHGNDGVSTLKVYQESFKVGTKTLGHNSKVVHMYK